MFIIIIIIIIINRSRNNLLECSLPNFSALSSWAKTTPRLLGGRPVAFFLLLKF